ncbi:MAG: hypothetical protein JO186_04480, partial [Actinobacteria bacterium]|nr:hypothetical protein [Actinomycetota bacterium]
MPGQAHRAVPRLLGFAAAAFLGVVLPAFGSPDPLGNAAALRLQNAHLEAKSRSAVLSLYSLDSRIAAADSRLSGLRTRLAALRFQRTVLRRELQVARAGEEISEQELASRVRELYDQGDVSPLEVVFGASSLADAMTQLDNVQHVASLDDDMVTQLQAARTRLMTTQATLALRTRQLEQDVQAAASVEASLLDTRASRDAYIAGLAHQRDL